MRILFTMSGSSPSTPPGYMTSFTWPAEILRHRSPINCRAWCQGEPSGASVPILMTVCGMAGVTHPSNSTLIVNRNISLLLSRRSGTFEEQVIGPAQHPARPALRHQVGQPRFGMPVGIDVQRAFQQFLKLGPVLRRNAGVLGVGNEQAGAPPARKLQRLFIVALHSGLAFHDLHTAARRLDIDQELRQRAF